MSTTALCCPFCHSTEFPSKAAFRNHRQFCEFLTNTVDTNANGLDAATTVAPAVYHQVVRNLVCEMAKMNKQMSRLSATVAQLKRKQTIPLQTYLDEFRVPPLTFEQWSDLARIVVSRAHLTDVFAGGLVHGMISCLEFNIDSDLFTHGGLLPLAAVPARSAKNVYVYSASETKEKVKWQLLTTDVLHAYLKKLSGVFMTKYLEHTKEMGQSSSNNESAMLQEIQNMKSVVCPIRNVDVLAVMRALYKKAQTVEASVKKATLVEDEVDEP